MSGRIAQRNAQGRCSLWQSDGDKTKQFIDAVIIRCLDRGPPALLYVKCVSVGLTGDYIGMFANDHEMLIRCGGCWSAAATWPPATAVFVAAARTRAGATGARPRAARARVRARTGAGFGSRSGLAALATARAAARNAAFGDDGAARIAHGHAGRAARIARVEASAAAPAAETTIAAPTPVATTPPTTVAAKATPAIAASVTTRHECVCVYETNVNKKVCTNLERLPAAKEFLIARWQTAAPTRPSFFPERPYLRSTRSLNRTRLANPCESAASYPIHIVGVFVVERRRTKPANDLCTSDPCARRTMCVALASGRSTASRQCAQKSAHAA